MTEENQKDLFSSQKNIKNNIFGSPFTRCSCHNHNKT